MTICTLGPRKPLSDPTHRFPHMCIPACPHVYVYTSIPRCTCMCCRMYSTHVDSLPTSCIQCVYICQAQKHTTHPAHTHRQTSPSTPPPEDNTEPTTTTAAAAVAQQTSPSGGHPSIDHLATRLANFGSGVYLGSRRWMRMWVNCKSSLRLLQVPGSAGVSRRLIRVDQQEGGGNGNGKGVKEEGDGGQGGGSSSASGDSTPPVSARSWPPIRGGM